MQTGERGGGGEPFAQGVTHTNGRFRRKCVKVELCTESANIGAVKN